MRTSFTFLGPLTGSVPPLLWSSLLARALFQEVESQDRKGEVLRSLLQQGSVTELQRVLPQGFYEALRALVSAQVSFHPARRLELRADLDALTQSRAIARKRFD